MIKKKNAQVSTEFLVILAVAMIFIVALFFIYQTQSIGINQAQEEAKAKNALSDLSGAAKEIYAQGYGAKKQVYVNVPSGIDPTKSYVANRSIRIHSNGADYVAEEAFDLRGTLPISEGGHLVWVVSEGNRVRIGYAMIDLDKQVLLVTMMPNETKTSSFRITNVWSSPINVSLSDRWDHEKIAFSMDDYFVELNVDADQLIHASFNTDDDALGIYVSEISMIADDSAGSVEYVRLPVILQVVPDPRTRPPLIIIPSLFNASINRSASASRNFQVCTNEVTSLSSVIFNPSIEAPGNWTAGLGDLGPMAADTCVEKTITVNVPDNAFVMNHTGYVTVDGIGNPEAKDSLGLLIDVGGVQDDEGPDVYNITTRERRVHEKQPTTFYAIADDNLTGGSNIQGCKISVDEGAVWSMFPSDGRFDFQTEPVHYIYPDGFLTGTHVAKLNCTDEWDNTGPTREFNFTIGKHILFVIASGNESAWSDWIEAFKYKASYDWTHDIANFDEVKSGIVNLWYYDTVIFLAWDNDDDFVNMVTDYHDFGGFVGLFGPSAHLAVRDLEIEWHPDNPHVETHINILNGSHYVSQDLVENFTTGMLQISPVKTKFYLLWGGEDTNQIGGSGWFYPETKRLMLAEVERTLFWGVEEPFRLNDQGNEITARVIDWMINQSLVE
jgi:hypothetical protein